MNRHSAAVCCLSSLIMLLLPVSCMNKSAKPEAESVEYHRVVVDASVYRGLMQMLGVGDRCIDFSDQMQPDVEKIAEARPDLLMLSAYEGADLSRYRKLGVRIVECKDFLEPTALGRAAWMKEYGRLWGVGEKADSLYSEVEQNYRQIKGNTPRSEWRGTGGEVIFDLLYGDEWYQPRCQSTIGQLMADAGGCVVDMSDVKGGSVSYTAEQLLKEAHDASVWIIRYGGPRPLTLDKLADLNPVYSQFEAFRKGNVFVSYVSQNNYYDESPWRPDYLLQDFENILQGRDKPLRYFERIK